MAGVSIVTDSACDLSAAETASLGVTVVPLTIRFGSEEFTDREQLSVEDFYERMAATSDLPETAAPSPGAFEAAFRSAAANGNSVVCINISSELSATMQSANNAATAVGDDIDVRVVDSQSITGGLGTEVRLAAKAAADGASADEVVALVEGLRSRVHVYGALDTLDNLKKGGRVGGAQALLGSILSIKPVIDISSGRVEEAAKPRTRRKSLQWLYDRLLEAGEVEELSVLHGAAPDIEDFLTLIEPTHPRETIHQGLIGAVIGTHGGPRVIGITYLDPSPS